MRAMMREIIGPPSMVRSSSVNPESTLREHEHAHRDLKSAGARTALDLPHMKAYTHAHHRTSMSGANSPRGNSHFLRLQQRNTNEDVVDSEKHLQNQRYLQNQKRSDNSWSLYPATQLQLNPKLHAPQELSNQLGPIDQSSGYLTNCIESPVGHSEQHVLPV